MPRTSIMKNLLKKARLTKVEEKPLEKVGKVNPRYTLHFECVLPKNWSNSNRKNPKLSNVVFDTEFFKITKNDAD